MVAPTINQRFKSCEACISSTARLYIINAHALHIITRCVYCKGRLIRRLRVVGDVDPYKIFRLSEMLYCFCFVQTKSQIGKWVWRGIYMGVLRYVLG